MCFLFFFFNDTATTEIYTLSLHDALPICSQYDGRGGLNQRRDVHNSGRACVHGDDCAGRDRKSTRLNSSHGYISYAVFCLKKKNTGAHYWRSPRSDATSIPPSATVSLSTR